jgi:hypothetical protein
LALQIFANIFLARLGNVRGLQAKKFGIPFFEFPYRSRPNSRRGEARQRSHPPIAPAAELMDCCAALTMTAGRFVEEIDAPVRSQPNTTLVFPKEIVESLDVRRR